MGKVFTFGIAGLADLEGERLVVVDAEHHCIVQRGCLTTKVR